MRLACIQSDQLFESSIPKFTVVGPGYACRDLDMAFIRAPVVMFLHDNRVSKHFEQRLGVTCCETLC